MKKIILASMLGALVMMSGCKKDSPQTSGTDIASTWVGVYNGNPYGSPSQITISRVSDSTVSVIIKVTQDSYQYTATTLTDVKLTGTVGQINETKDIIEYTDLGTYKFTGSLTIRGNEAIMNATAVSVTPNNENSPQNFNFSGSKQ